MKETIRSHLALVGLPVITALLVCYVVVLPAARQEAEESVRVEVQQLEEVIAQLQAMVEGSSTPPRVKVTKDDGTERYYYRGLDESDASWAQRIHRIVNGQEIEALYICTTLTGCEPPTTQIEVCTPCNSTPPSAQCEANHAASVAAFCAEFDCTDCDG